MRDRRVAAAARFEASSLPSVDEEVWRYSRVAELELDAWSTPAAPLVPPSVPDGARAILAAYTERAAAVVVVDGAAVLAEVAGRWAARGVTAGPIGATDRGEGQLGRAASEAMGRVGGGPVDVFALMNDAFASEPILVDVPDGVVVDAPVVVIHWFEGRGTAAFPRLVVRLGQDAQAAVVDVHASGADAAVFTAPVTELDLDRSARLGYLNVQELGAACWQIASQVSSVDAEAALLSACAGFGGDYARQRTDCRLVGRGATGTLIAVYFGEADQTLDFRTFQDHAAPDTTSDLLFKGAVAGHSHSVYTGLIRVRKEAARTNAFQTNRNIKLSDGAWALSVPNLKIENNDVSCSHASAVGPIDEDQRFYLESRGVPPTVAERLVVTGFFDEVLGRVPVAAAVPDLRRAVAAKLERCAL
ncbi:Fe-S cluster assembly protein SufD [soil metagenome]